MNLSPVDDASTTRKMEDIYLKNEKITKRIGTLYLVTSAVIAALYVVLTLPFAQFAFGPIQFRLAEMMVVLPIMTPAAIPGLTLGCFLSNFLNPNNLGPIDIIFGSLATLLAALSTRFISQRFAYISQMPRDIASLIPPVIFNAVIVGTYLTYLLPHDNSITLAVIGVSILSVGLSEAITVFALGLPFLMVMRRSGIEAIWKKK